jgi:hypothetical protein
MSKIRSIAVGALVIVLVILGVISVVYVGYMYGFFDDLLNLEDTSLEESVDFEGGECPSESGKIMTFEEAREIAMESSCADEGNILDSGSCNVDTGTWWINLDAEKENCFPACVVDVESENAVINWRCTGIPVEGGVTE